MFELQVAATVGKGIVDPDVVDNYVIFGALIGAIAWNVITWYYGMPSSSSHALIGGMIGATIAKAGHRPAAGAGHHQDLVFHRRRAGARHAACGAHHGRRVVDLPATDRSA